MMSRILFAILCALVSASLWAADSHLYAERPGSAPFLNRSFSLLPSCPITGHPEVSAWGRMGSARPSADAVILRWR